MDERLALMDIRQVRRLNGWDEHDVSCLEISLGGDGGKAAARRRAEVYDAVGEIIMTEDQPLDAPVVVRQISEIYPGLFDWLALLDLNVLVVMILMMAVAGFNMISSLLIILFERISMIGLLKSLGMRTVSICKVFIYRGGAIVLRGMVWGCSSCAAGRAEMAKAVQAQSCELFCRFYSGGTESCAYTAGGRVGFYTDASYNDSPLAVCRTRIARQDDQSQLNQPECRGFCLPLSP